MSSSRSLRSTGGRSSKSKRGAKVAAKARQRVSAYRATTREAATAAYHVDARVMARMGYIPESEDWSTQVEQVLVVGYVEAPERAPAVLKALEEAAAEPAAEVPAVSLPPTIAGQARRWVALELPLEVKLALGALGGVLAGLAVGLLLGVVSGENPNAIILGGFGLLGLLLGSMLGFSAD